MNISFRKEAFPLLCATLVLAACQKSMDSGETVSSEDYIAVAASRTGTTALNSTTTASSDSVYVMHSCGPRGTREAIDPATLSTTITSYIAANYEGFTWHKAFAAKNAAGAVVNYVAIIYFNDKPVALLFDSTGSFIKVLEQREKGDLRGRGHHFGGRFEHRDGQQRDTIILSNLPTAITAYFAATYPTDTLMKAFKGKDNSIAVVSVNNGVFVTIFNAQHAFVKRVAVTGKRGHCAGIEQSALPAAAVSYLNTTYPNYVFKKAFALKTSGTVTGYIVLIDANSTKYAVEFDAAGSYVKSKALD